MFDKWHCLHGSHRAILEFSSVVSGSKQSSVKNYTGYLSCSRHVSLLDGQLGVMNYSNLTKVSG